MKHVTLLLFMQYPFRMLFALQEGHLDSKYSTYFYSMQIIIFKYSMLTFFS